MDIPFSLPSDKLSPTTQDLLRAVAAPACSARDAEGLEALCDLAYWLYIDHMPAQAMALTHLIADREFDGNYDTWTWIEFALALRSRLAQASGSNAEVEVFRRQALRAVESGDEGKVKIKRKVHARFLAGSQLQFDKVQAAIDQGDRVSELGWRVVHLRNQVKLEQFGGSDAVPLAKLTSDITANLQAIRTLCGAA